MSGIYGVIANRDISFKNKISGTFYSSEFTGVKNEDFNYQNFFYGRSVLSQFEDDRIVFEDDLYIVMYEGVIFNKEGLSTADYLISKYNTDAVNFANEIKGQFCGFIYDKSDNSIHIFTDQLSTKSIYYYASDDIFIFSSEMKVISQLLDDLKIIKIVDYDAVYSMLTFGHMLNDITYEKNTKKQPPFTILSVDNNLTENLHIYNEFKYTAEHRISISEVCIHIDKLLRASVKNCWKKDKEYNYEHCSQLSGGLDSRVNLFLAKELDFDKVTTLTFSQSNSSDDKIAQEICTKEGYKHIFSSLDGGIYLERNIEKYIYANDGLNNFIGSASGFDFLQSINHSRYGALHTGQIGDLLFGSYVKENYKIENTMATNRIDLLEKISFIDEFRGRYNDKSEIFAYEQRVPNGALNGDRTCSHFVDMLSPFYDVELINYCLNIPKKFKVDEKIYLDWFNVHCKSISEYKWESAGVKPKNITVVKIAKFIKRYKNGVLRRLGFNINDMNPFDIWLRDNKKIYFNLNSIFENNINLVKDEKLKDILNDMFNTDVKFSHYGRNNKFIVITLLLSLKLHFPNGGQFEISK